jgi:molybdopterin synthase sulfur carrier subunit
MTLAMTINITIKLFAIYQETYGVPELTLELPSQTPINAVLDQMIALHPALSPWQEVTRFGVNYQFVEGDTLLQDGDELVLIPPVSGG